MRKIDIDIAYQKVERFILRGYSVTMSCKKAHVNRNVLYKRLPIERRVAMNILCKKHHQPNLVGGYKLERHEIATIIEAHVSGLSNVEIGRKLNYKLYQIYGAVNKYYGVPRSEYSSVIVMQSKINDELPELVGDCL